MLRLLSSREVVSMSLYDEVRRYHNIETSARHVLLAYEVGGESALALAIDDLRADLERED